MMAVERAHCPQGDSRQDECQQQRHGQRFPFSALPHAQVLGNLERLSRTHHHTGRRRRRRGHYGRRRNRFSARRGWAGRPAARGSLGRRLLHSTGLSDLADPILEARIRLDGPLDVKCQNLIARGDFGKMNIRLDANLLQIRNPVGGQFVVQVLGHGIGVQPDPTSLQAGCPQFLPVGGTPDAVNQSGGKLALLDLPAKLLDFRRIFDDIVQVSEHVA
jgi:hypothetical protein